MTNNIKVFKLGIMVHNSNPSTQGTERRRITSFRPVWSKTLPGGGDGGGV